MLRDRMVERGRLRERCTLHGDGEAGESSQVRDVFVPSRLEETES